MIRGLIEFLMLVALLIIAYHHPIFALALALALIIGLSLKHHV